MVSSKATRRAKPNQIIRQMKTTTRKTQNSVLAFAGWKKVKGGYAQPESFGGRAVTRRVALAIARHDFKAA